jgi:hypothetical protein
MSRANLSLDLSTMRSKWFWGKCVATTNRHLARIAPIWYDFKKFISRWADTHTNLLFGQGGRFKQQMWLGDKQLNECQPVLSGGFFYGRICS